MNFFKKKLETIILSVGGSLIVPNGGIDTDFLAKLNQFVRKHVERGRRFFIVVGGGQTARVYCRAAADVVGKITHEDLDWLGIHATRLNGHILRTIFQDIAHPRIIENYDKKLTSWEEPVVIGAGWKPGWSTDYDAVVLARDYHGSVIINLSNIDWVYTKDPAKYKDAKPIKKITWVEFEQLVGNKWVPGTHAPFDPVAAQLAKKERLSVIITNGKNFKNLDNILAGESFKGTAINLAEINESFYDREYFEGKKGEYRLGYAESSVGNLLQNIVNFYRALWIKLLIKPRNCLDVGCGTGRLVAFLRKLGVEAYGTEISRYALEQAHPSVKPYLKEGSIVKIPYEDNQFDLVTTVDVLEHLERSQLKKAVDETVRVSRKWIMHKVYTYENKWITLFHAKDVSHVSVLSQSFWTNLFKTIDSIAVVRKTFLKLPSFFETVFLLKKK